MSWVRVDDKLYRNAKQLAMTDAEFRTWVLSWTYCADMPEPTGELSKAEAEQFVRGLGKPLKVIERLVELRAWDRTDGGFRVHDLNVRRDAKTSAERMRSKRAAARNGDGDVTKKRHTSVTRPSPQSDGDVTGCDALARGVPSPVPVPVPTPPAGSPPADQRFAHAHPPEDLEGSIDTVLAAFHELGIGERNGDRLLIRNRLWEGDDAETLTWKVRKAKERQPELDAVFRVLAYIRGDSGNGTETIEQQGEWRPNLEAHESEHERIKAQMRDAFPRDGEGDFSTPGELASPFPRQEAANG
jgi:hypothetical protein